MAYATKPAGADPLAHTIYVWPSQQLIARSWAWPEAWHAAYEHAASEVGRDVAVRVLGGLAAREQSIELKLGVAWVSFTVRVFETSIFVSITAFDGPDGPDSPGPNGGREQPRSADGLILGLRGTGKSFVLVTFYGYLPPLPVGYSPGNLAPVLFSKGNGIGNAGNDCGRILKILKEFPMSASDRSDAEPGVFGAHLEQPAREGRAVATPRLGVAVLSTPAGGNGTGNARHRDQSSCWPWSGRTEGRGDPCLPSAEKDLMKWTVQATGLSLSRAHCSYLH
jgi:hypothetical protein